MLIKFFRNGKGAGAGPVGYLVADKVLAYDDNRDLIRDAGGQPMTVTREPLPEVLRGKARHSLTGRVFPQEMSREVGVTHTKRFKELLVPSRQHPLDAPAGQ